MSIVRSVSSGRIRHAVQAVRSQSGQRAGARILAAAAIAVLTLSAPMAPSLQAQPTYRPASANPALTGFTPANAVLVYVDYTLVHKAPERVQHGDRIGPRPAK